MIQQIDNENLWEKYNGIPPRASAWVRDTLQKISGRDKAETIKARAIAYRSYSIRFKSRSDLTDKHNLIGSYREIPATEEDY